MDRRELLKMVALLTGGVVIGGEVFLSGCTSGAKEIGFTPGNIALLDEVGETIIPATSTPGAKAARVGEFMKVFVTDCYTPENQEVFFKGLTDLEDACKKMHNIGFMDCTPAQRKELLLSLEKEAKEFNKGQEEKDKPRREELKKKQQEYDFIASPRHYYTMMKQLTLTGFFTSKPGATEALRHVAVPGKYDGNFPYKKGDRAWG